MKRKVERDTELPGFSIEPAEFEALWDRLMGLFDSDERTVSQISINIPGESLEFEDAKELSSFSGLEGRVHDFSFWISQGDRSVSLHTNRPLTSRARFSASGESEAWCAGAMETVISFLGSHTVWYNWIVIAPIGWLLVILFNAPGITLLLIEDEPDINIVFGVAWIVAFISLLVLYIFRGKLFPGATIQFTSEEKFIRRHSAEISLVIALLSALLTMAGWFLD